MDEASKENLAVTRDMALMLKKGAELYDSMRSDLDSGCRTLNTASRQEISLKLRTLNRELLRGAEFLKDRLVADIYKTERWAETYHCAEQHMSLAKALSHDKKYITSDFYIESAFNQ